MNNFQKVIIEGYKQEFCVLNIQSTPEKVHEHLLRLHRSYVINKSMQRLVLSGRFTILPKEDARESFLSTLSPFDRFQREVADQLIIMLDIANGDAQGICEAQDDVISECFRERLGVMHTAIIVAKQNTTI